MNIPTASDVWKNQENKGDFDRACDIVIREIEKAAEAGRRYAHFDPRPVEQYDAVKAAFEQRGFSFRPTGYVGGVWQQTERVCW